MCIEAQFGKDEALNIPVLKHSLKIPVAPKQFSNSIYSWDEWVGRNPTIRIKDGRINSVLQGFPKYNLIHLNLMNATTTNDHEPRFIVANCNHLSIS